MGGGGGGLGEVGVGEGEKKNSCTASSPEKKSCIGLPIYFLREKNSTKRFRRKKFLYGKFEQQQQNLAT